MFICSYTCSAKQYADERFISNIKNLMGDNQVLIVDNTSNTMDYYNRLLQLTEGYNIRVERTDIDAQPERTRFLRSVAESANLCRDEFLKSDEQYMLIIESDVIPPIDIVTRLEKRISDLDDFAAIGALYYDGFHNADLEGLQPTHHCLSGCTVYNRKYLENIPFRWSEENLGAFSDAYWCVDLNQTPDKQLLFNDHGIHCKHLAMANGSRGY